MITLFVEQITDYVGYTHDTWDQNVRQKKENVIAFPQQLVTISR